MVIDFIGNCVINLLKSLKYIFTGRISIKNMLIQSAIIGYDSAPIAVIISLVAGSVLALQLAKQFAMSGAEAYVGGLISVAIIREMAPILQLLLSVQEPVLL